MHTGWRRRKDLHTVRLSRINVRAQRKRPVMLPGAGVGMEWKRQFQPSTRQGLVEGPSRFSE